MITLHHLEYSQSFRILWLLEELGVEYELKLYQRDEKTKLAPLNYKVLSPLGTAPVITDESIVISESNAIIDYILDKHPSNTLRPEPGNEYRVRYLFWMHASQGSLMPALLMSMMFRIIPERVPFFLKPIIKPVLNMANTGFTKPRLTALLKQAEADLETADWFGGDQLTAADISMSYPMESMRSNGTINERHPNCLAWLDRMHTSTSFQNALKKDGKSSFVFSFN